MIAENFMYLGAAFYVFGYYFYLRSMFKGETRPNLVSWCIWIIAPMIGVFFQLKAGAGLSILPIFMAGFGPVIVVLAALWKKNAFWKINSFDLVCGAFALIALVIYIITHSLELSIIFAILADALAFTPTFKKAWTNPESENGLLYVSTTVVNIVGLLVIKDWSFTIYSFGLVLIFMNLAMVAVIYRKKIFPPKEPTLISL